MNSKVSKARKLLKSCIRGKVPYVYGQGYRWVHRQFIPALQLLGSRGSKQDHPLIADGCYLLGDVHDFNGAPKAAIRAYRQCLSWDSRVGAAWREIGSMLERLGNFRAARSSLRKAVALDPEDEFAQMDLKALEEGRVASVYHLGDPLWSSSELLAQGRIKAAMVALARHTSVKARQARARILAACGESNLAIEEWSKIAKSSEPVEMMGADSFYTVDLLRDSAPFWELISRIAPRAQHGWWPIPDDLWKVILGGKRGKAKRQLDAKSLRKGIRVFSQYHVARITNDKRSMLMLVHKYPGWSEPKQWLRGFKGSKQ